MVGERGGTGVGMENEKIFNKKKIGVSVLFHWAIPPPPKLENLMSNNQPQTFTYKEIIDSFMDAIENTLHREKTI